MDTTFNMNELYLSLSIIVGIINTKKTFPLIYYYITSKSTKSFDFVIRELTKYIFYDYPKAAVIYANFTKGLGATMVARALRDISIEDKALQ